MGRSGRFEGICSFGLSHDKKVVGPKKDEIVTCDGYNAFGFLFLKEYAIMGKEGRYAYQENCFQPVVPQEEIEKLMESINQPA